MESTGHLFDELLPDAILQQLLRVHFDHSHQGRLHEQNTFREDGDIMSQLSHLYAANKLESSKNYSITEDTATTQLLHGSATTSVAIGMM